MGGPAAATATATGTVPGRHIAMSAPTGIAIKASAAGTSRLRGGLGSRISAIASAGAGPREMTPATGAPRPMWKQPAITMIRNGLVSHQWRDLVPRLSCTPSILPLGWDLAENLQ